MDLKDFIAKTIGDCIEGYKLAKAGPSGTHVAPYFDPRADVTLYGISGISNNRPVVLVHIDAAFTVDYGGDAGLGGELKVIGVGALRANLGGKARAQDVHRVQFAVPVQLP